MSNKTILITGANGYIGRHVTNKLNKQDYRVIAIDFCNTNLDKNIKFINLDILDTENIYEQLQTPDILIHLAWKNGFNHKSEDHIKYIYYHYNFIKKLIDSGCKNINVMGSMHEVGYYKGELSDTNPPSCNPLSLYGIGKNCLRQSLAIYSEEKQVSLKWLRGFYIIGDDKNNNSIFSKILQMNNNGKSTFPFTDGKNKYDFIDVNTLSDYIIAASIQTEVNGIINICSGKPISLKDKVEEFIKINNLQIKPEYNVFPNRKYDSPIIYGSTDKIQKIMEKQK